MITSDISELTTQLAAVIGKNAAAAVSSKINALRTRKLDSETMNQLIELVNDLIADKNELIGIATAFEQELVAQRISEDDITYITTQLIPLLEELASYGDGDERSTDALSMIKRVLSPEMLTIMQLVGFNFRRAIGEPLTVLVERVILNRLPTPDEAPDLAAAQVTRETAYFNVLLDPEARAFLG